MTRPLALAALLALAACTNSPEYDGRVRAFAEQDPPIQFTRVYLPTPPREPYRKWDLTGYVKRTGPGRWEIGASDVCAPGYPHPTGYWHPFDPRMTCERMDVAHVATAYRREREIRSDSALTSRCEMELWKHKVAGLVPDLIALGCDHTGRPL